MTGDFENMMAKFEAEESSMPEELKKGLAKMPQEVLTAYYGLREQILKDGELSRKLKLLILAGILTVMRAEEALVTYSRSALNAGATPRELIEAMSVGALFSGGPGMIVISKAIRSLGL